MAIQVADGFSLKSRKPLDARLSFDTVADMVATPTADVYDGCFAYVTATQKYYSYDSTNSVDVTLGKWREYSSGGHTIEDAAGTALSDRSNLQFKGAVSVSDDSTNNATVVDVDAVQVDMMPTAAVGELGNVYQYIGADTVNYTHGYFYECVEVSTGVYGWENVDVQENETVQYVTMPVASADDVGKVVQYIGATNASYTHNRFYECVSDGAASPTYSWDEQRVEETETVQMSMDDFDLLTPAEKNNGQAYFIPDAEILTSFTVIGNRFDKANIYTATERMVGSFLGKPMYQKTFENVTPTDGQVTALVTGVDRVVDFIFDRVQNSGSSARVYHDGSRNENYVVVSVNNGNLYLEILQATYAAGEGTLTVRYTKSADATVNIGTENDYSTTETIVGTWTDNSLIYQKTISGTLSISGGIATLASMPGIGHLVNATGEIIYSNQKVLMPGTSSDVLMVGDNLSCVPANTFNGCAYTLTVQYTKTT